MQAPTSRDSVVRDWLPVVAWTLFIYATIPLARAVQWWVMEHWTRAAFSWAVYASVAIGVLAAIHQFRRRAVPVARRQWIVLGVLAAIFAWGTWHLRGNAEEAMHLPQYGVLSLLLYRAYSRRYGDRGAYACAALLGAFLGIFDEVIQWAVPRRVFQFRDIIINVLSVLLIQAGLVAGLATRCRAVPAGLRSARAAWRLAVLVLLLLLGCFSNTPAVWHPLYSSWPNLFVFDEAMVQYGHRIHDPEVGWFKSRLTADQLRDTDAARAEEAGEILRRMGHDDDYGVFLSRYSPMRDPFLHELRVRLFRRDRHSDLARANLGDPAKHAGIDQHFLHRTAPAGKLVSAHLARRGHGLAGRPARARGSRLKRRAPREPGEPRSSSPPASPSGRRKRFWERCSLASRSPPRMIFASAAETCPRHDESTTLPCRIRGRRHFAGLAETSLLGGAGRIPGIDARPVLHRHPRARRMGYAGGDVQRRAPDE